MNRRIKMGFIVVLIILFSGVFIFIVGGLIYIAYQNSKGNGAKFPISRLPIYYVGGLDNIDTRYKGAVELFKSHILITLNWKEYNVPIGNIKDLYFKTEEQLKENITLTRLLIFGVFALGMKKQNISNRRFLVIEYIENNEDKTVILESETSTIEFIDKYNNLKIKPV